MSFLFHSSFSQYSFPFSFIPPYLYIFTFSSISTNSFTYFISLPFLLVPLLISFSFTPPYPFTHFLSPPFLLIPLIMSFLFHALSYIHVISLPIPRQHYTHILLLRFLLIPLLILFSSIPPDPPLLISFFFHHPYPFSYFLSPSLLIPLLISFLFYSTLSFNHVLSLPFCLILYSCPFSSHSSLLIYSFPFSSIRPTPCTHFLSLPFILLPLLISILFHSSLSLNAFSSLPFFLSTYSFFSCYVLPFVFLLHVVFNSFCPSTQRMCKSGSSENPPKGIFSLTRK